MGKIFCIIGKTSTGKDTIYQKLLENKSLSLQKIVPYTTRPIREGEKHGESYFFVDEGKMRCLQEQGRVIECRAYHTVHGIWYYFTVKDEQIDLDKQDYLIIGTLEAYLQIRKYFGEDEVIPIYIEIDPGEQLTRALQREKMQSEPKYEEMCRRFLSDSQDFSEENIMKAGITKRFMNYELSECMKEISDYILAVKKGYKEE